MPDEVSIIINHWTTQRREGPIISDNGHLEGHYPIHGHLRNKYILNQLLILYINRVKIVRGFLQVTAERTNSRLVDEQRDRRDSTAEVDQLCCISVFKVIKLTKYVKINDKITHSALPL